MSLQRGELSPESSTFDVFFSFHGYTRPSLLFAECVPHYSDGLHWRLTIDILRLHGDDAIVVVNRKVWVLVPCGLVFLLDLRLTV